ncbi:MAG: hypothetical protein IJU00_04710 [Selenomonas sp.]|nr:hypothetical protein [Selenomonas sp.]
MTLCAAFGGGLQAIIDSTALSGSDEPISWFAPGGHLRRAYQFYGVPDQQSQHYINC